MATLPDKVPANREIKISAGGHLKGCRIGFDLGASDYKVSAVIDGNPVFTATNTVEFAMTGSGRSLGIASGDWNSNEPFKGTSRKAYHGKVLIVIQSTMVPGTIKLTVNSPGLTPATLTLTTQPQMALLR